MKRPRPLACACCGGGAGSWLQWWNQDTGHGLCARCANAIKARGGWEADELDSNYGREGEHRAPAVLP